MTERVYYTSDATDGRAQIIACTAEADGRYAIELDRTLFHPQGGGQPADRGWIAGQVVETVAVSCLWPKASTKSTPSVSSHT